MPELARRTLIAASLVLLSIACGREASQLAAGEPPAQSPSGEPSSTSDLGICSTPRVSYVKTEPPPSGSSTREEAAAKAGGTGEPSRLVHGNVTMGMTVGKAPASSDDVSRDGSGPIQDRPAWIFVFENQRAPLTGGPVDVENPENKDRPTLNMSAFALVYDSKTGHSLGGWSCQTRTEYPDGRVVTRDVVG